MKEKIKKIIIIFFVLALILFAGSNLILEFLKQPLSDNEAKETIIESTEILLDELQEGKNQAGSLMINKIELSLVDENEFFALGIDIKKTVDDYKNFVIYYKNKEVDRLSMMPLHLPDPTFYYFNYGEEKYFVVMQLSSGSGGIWNDYLFYLMNDDFEEVLSIRENEYSNRGAHYFIDYKDKLYIISFYTGRFGAGSYYGGTYVSVLNQHGEIEDSFVFDKPDEKVYIFEEWVYPQATSLLERDNSLYLKITNAQDGVDKYYLLDNGNLIESSF